LGRSPPGINFPETETTVDRERTIAENPQYLRPSLFLFENCQWLPRSYGLMFWRRVPILSNYRKGT
jgi:hypothetical protein